MHFMANYIHALLLYLETDVVYYQYTLPNTLLLLACESAHMTSLQVRN